MSLLLLALTLSFSAQAAPEAPNVSLLRELVSISSGTADISGVNRVQKKLGERFKALGFQVELLPNPQGGSGDLLVATLGHGPGFVTLVGHSDTVFEKLNPFVRSGDGKTARGSGVIDDKGGLVVILSALAELLKTGTPRFPLRVIISPSEETGSHGFYDLFMRYSRDSWLILGFEPAREDGSIVSSRKGARWYHIKVQGRESHAGVDHAFGINACQELAVKLDRIERLTDYKTGATASIGRMEGGKDKYNIVCGEAEAKVDARAPSPEIAHRLYARIEEILHTQVVRSAKTGDRAVTSFEITEDVPPLAARKASAELIGEYVRAIKSVEGRTVGAEPTGGAADLNRMDRPGLRIVDALGPFGAGMHTAAEWINLSSLDTRSRALVAFLRALPYNSKKGEASR